MNLKQNIFFLLIALLLICLNCTDFMSSNNSRRSGKIINVPEDFSTIQEAIISAHLNDIVLVAPGEYIEEINFLGKSIVVKSSDGPLETIITNLPEINLVTFNNGENWESTLEGFTLKSGNIGVLCENSSPTIQRNLFINQNVERWGAISLGGNGYATTGESPAIIENNTIIGCTNGGISTFSTIPPTIKNNIIAFNNHYGIHREGRDTVAQPNLSYNNIFGNSVSYQEIADPGIGTISENPLFFSNYYLGENSPCINAGDPDPKYNDPDSSRNDMGALHYINIPPHDPTTINVPADFPTIQEAIDYSTNDDIIVVSPGIYDEQINFLGKAIHVRSSDGPLETIITNSAYNNLVTFTNGESSTSILEGFNLEGGSIAILCENAGPTIKNNILSNQNIYNWGAISLGGENHAIVGESPAVIINNTIINCNNGGISTFSTIAPVIMNNIIAFNSHYGIHRNSTGLPHPIMSYNNVYGNSESFQNIDELGDGALSINPVFNSDYSLSELSPCIDAGNPNPEFNDPDGSRNDIGAVPYFSTEPQESNVIYVPSDYESIQQAIEVSSDNDSIIVAPGTYEESLNFLGKAIVVISSDGPLTTVITSPSYTNIVIFTNNESHTSVLEGFTLQGGKIGILCENAGPTIKNNILRDQNITDWGAISLGGNGYGTSGNSPAVIINNTIVNCYNGAISTFSTAAPIIMNNILAFNGHYGIHRNSTNLPHPIMSYNDVYGNSVSFQNISELGEGALSENPIFNEDYSLKSNSPCINAGNPNAEYNDPDGSRNDMGAVPYNPLDLIKYISDANVVVDKELMVKDVMRHNVVSVKPDDTLKEVANQMFRNRLSALAVVDENNKLLGAISDRDLIKAALPDYKTLISNLNYSMDVEPFEELLKREDKIKVSQLYRDDYEVTTPNTRIVEVAAMMIFKDVTRVFVTSDDNLVGILLRKDIVNMIIRG